TFAPAPHTFNEVPNNDVAKLRASAELKLRPNTTTELYLWVLNPTENKDDFIVEVAGPKGSLAVRSKVISIPGDTWARVRLPKPAPPAPPATPPAAPAAPPAGTPPPATEPPPPGVALPLAAGEGKLTFRLLDKNGNEVKDNAGKIYAKDFAVRLRAPSDYVDTPVTRVAPGRGVIGMSATVTQKPFAFPGSATVQLNIPPQPALKDAFIREGIYRR